MIATSTLRPEQFVRSGDLSAADAINRAIEAASRAGGGTVELDATTYEIAGPVMLKSGVTLRGQGSSRTRIRQTGTPKGWGGGIIGGGLIGTEPSGQYEGIHVAAISLVGLHKVPLADGAGFYAKNGISIANARNSSVVDCVVEDTGTGIIFHGIAGAVAEHRNVIANCTVRRARSWVGNGVPGTPRGITMATSHSTVRDCVTVDCHTGYYVATEHGDYANCKTRGWVDDGFYLNANDVTLLHCEAIKGAGSGFAVNPSTSHLFRECVAIECSNAGLRFRHAGQDAPSNTQVLDCTFNNCGFGFLDDMTGADSFPAGMAKGNRFIGNTAEACAQNGFMFVRQSGGIIRANRAIANNRSGVTLQSRGGIALGEYCLDNIVEDNLCDDPQSRQTQVFGLYNYPTSLTGASLENRNRVRHRSRRGRDQIEPR
jgi:hypothetical protein